MSNSSKSDPIQQGLIFLPQPVAKRTTTIGIEGTFKYNIEGSPANRKIEDIFNQIFNEIVNPVLQSNIQDLKTQFITKLETFRARLAEFYNIMITTTNEEELLNITRLDYQIYEGFKAFIRQKNDILESIPRIDQFVNNLQDYENVFLGIMVKRYKELINALEKIDINDLKENVAGGFLAFYCILTILQENKLAKDKLSILLDLGIEYSEEMIIYVDTIDILSNPEAMIAVNKPNELQT